MIKRIICLVCLCIFFGVNGVSIAEENTLNSIAGTIGNVTFDASVSGSEIEQAAMYLVALKSADPDTDEVVIELFNQLIFKEDLVLEMEERSIGDNSIERTYYSEEAREKGLCNYYFNDEGGFGAWTEESTWYKGIMDIMSLEYSASCYISDRLECGDLPMMTAEEAVLCAYDAAEQIGLNIQADPYIVRAYAMDEQLVTQSGIHAYAQMIVQGNDLTAENRAVVSEYGPNCYFIAYRYEVDGIPISYSYHYIESEDYTTIDCNVQVLFNDTGMIQFCVCHQLEIQETSEYQTVISAQEASNYAAEYLNRILGVDPFVCKEISLEYIPLAYSGCDIEREACLVPAWVFYFDSLDVTPIMVNALNGEIII